MSENHAHLHPENDTGVSRLQQPVPHQHEGPLGAVDANQPPDNPLPPRRGLLVVAAVAVIILLLFVYLGIKARHSSADSLRSRTDTLAVPIVQITHPSPGTDAAEVVLPANVEAFVDTPIYGRTSGYIKMWYHDIGSMVQKGELLAVIEAPEIDKQVQQAQSDVKTSEANLGIAQITADRWQKLVKKFAVSQQESDQASSSLAAAQSNLAARKSALGHLEELQGFERIYAPFTGVVTVRNIDIGSLIQAEQNTAQKELFHMSAVDRLRVFVPVPEVYQSSVHVGEQIPITVDAFPGEKFMGTLTRTSRSVDQSSRTINVEVDVHNTTGKLLPGAYAFVHLPVPSTAQGLRIPSNTLLFRAQGTQVAVVEDGKVALHTVTIGHDYGATLEILSGLNATDQVVLDPSDSIETGDQVRVGNGLENKSE